MANVTFHVGTSAPGTSGLTADGLYFNKSSGGIYYATSATSRSEVASKVSFNQLVTSGATLGSISVNGTTTQIYTPSWVPLNGSTGVAWSTFRTNSTYKKAQRIWVNVANCPVKLFCPRVFSSSTTTASLNFILERAEGASWAGTSTYPSYFATGVSLPGSISYNSSSYMIHGYLLSLDTDSSGRTLAYYYHYLKYNGTTFQGGGHYTDTDTYDDGDITSYIKVMSVQY